MTLQTLPTSVGSIFKLWRMRCPHGIFEVRITSLEPSSLERRQFSVVMCLERDIYYTVGIFSTLYVHCTVDG
jgi:hypothetical protein